MLHNMLVLLVKVYSFTSTEIVTFKFSYLILLFGITYIYTAAVNPYIQKHQLAPEYSIAAYAIITINLILFLSTGFSDPGEITRDNQSVYYSVYEFDGIMFTKGNVCRTCGFEKPARSKHCGKQIDVSSSSSSLSSSSSSSFLLFFSSFSSCSSPSTF